MTTLHSYKDTRLQCWANIRLLKNEPIWISVAPSSVIVKNSTLGIFGKKLFEGGRNDNAYLSDTVANLQNKFPINLIPNDCAITKPVLVAFVNACLHCSNISEVEKVLNEIKKN